MMMADNPKITVEVKADGAKQTTEQLNALKASGLSLSQATKQLAAEQKLSVGAFKEAAAASKAAAEAIKQETLAMKNAALAAKLNEEALKKTAKAAGFLETVSKRLLAYLAVSTLVEYGRKLASVADEYKSMEGRVRLATSSLAEQKAVMQSLSETAKATGGSLNDIVSTFNRVAMSKNSIGATTKEMTQLTDIVTKLGTISGATTAGMSAGLLQFGQAMGSGVVHAEEWNSLLENMPAVVVEIAKGMNKSTGELRNMVLEGKILSKDVFEALLKQQTSVDANFAKMPLTFARVGAKSDLVFGKLISDLDKTSGITTDILGLLDKVTSWFGSNQAAIVATFNFIYKGMKGIYYYSEFLVKNLVVKIAEIVTYATFGIADLLESITKLSFGLVQLNNIASTMRANAGQGYQAALATTQNSLAISTAAFGEAVAPKMASAAPSFSEVRGSIYTPKEKEKKHKKTDAEREAEKYAGFLADLKTKLQDANLQAAGMASSMKALATQGLGAYQTQELNNQALETYNSLLGDYRDKKKSEVEALAHSIANKQRELEVMKQSMDFLKTMADRQKDLNLEIERNNMLRSAFATGGVKGYEDMQRQAAIMARRDELLGGMPNASEAQQNAALDLATMEDKKQRYRDATEQMVQQTKEMYSSIGDAVKSSFDQTIQYMLNGTSSFKDIMISLIQKVSAKLLGLFALQLATGLFTKFSGTSGLGGSIAGVAGKLFPSITSGVGAGGGVGTSLSAINVTSGLNIPARAGGGSVTAGTPYMVGERGRELFVPSSSGNVVAMPQGASGGGIQVVNNITVSGEQGNDPNGMMKAGQMIASMVEMKVREVLAKEARQGGMLRRGYA